MWRVGGKQRPFVFWLLLVQLAAILPLLAFATLITQHLVQRNEDEAVSQLDARVSIAAASMSREARRIHDRLDLLARYSSDPGAVRLLAAQLVSMDRLIRSVSIADGRGRTVFTTDASEGMGDADALRSASAATGADPRADGSSMAIAPFAVASSNGGVIVFSIPWSSNDNDAGALRIAVRASALGDHLRSQQWPPAWTAALLDQALFIVARSKDEDQFVGKQATASLQQYIARSGAGVTFATTKDGTEVVTAVARVAGTPWWLVAGLPRAALKERASAPLRQLLLGGAVLVMLGIALSVFLAKRLNRSVKAVAGGRSTGSTQVIEFRAVEMQRLMLDNNLIGIVRFRDRKSVWHNRALERMFGYDEGELEGHSPRLLHLDDASFVRFAELAYPSLREGRSFRTQLEMVRKDRSHLWVDVSGIELSSGETMWVIVDISALKAEQALIEQMAFRDSLTGLPNRKLLLDRLAHDIEALRRTDGMLAVCFIDLNGFKAVNDKYGHAAGDDLLKVVASRIEGCLRPSDTVARLGGDEFVLLLTRLAGRDEAMTIVGRVSDAIREPLTHADGDRIVTAAIGVAFAPDESTEAETLLKLADHRMYDDKHPGHSMG